MLGFDTQFDAVAIADRRCSAARIDGHVRSAAVHRSLSCAIRPRLLPSLSR
jgi:hypothetical protein